MNWIDIFRKKKGKVITKDDRSITFEVDGKLPVPAQGLWYMDGHEIEQSIIDNSDIINKKKQCIASSFRHEQLGWVGTDGLYKCMVDAYADHRALILSPDMIWLVLFQAFSHHINREPEKYRKNFVKHAGKKDIIIKTNQNLLSEDADWESVINSFNDKILQDSQSEHLSAFIEDFTTTGKVERIATHITVMDVVKSYYRFKSFWCVCGIPQITLEGTPKDWESILERVSLFEEYGLREWVTELKPILMEFVNASNGDINIRFWKSIVKKWNFGSLRGPNCGGGRGPSKLDGWFLKLFPYDQHGTYYKNAYYISTSLLPEIVRVDMNFVVHDPTTGDNKHYPMELIAGFVGVEENKETKALRPKIGWMVKEADSQKDKISYIKRMKDDGWIDLQIDEVPEELKSFRHIKQLSLTFKGHIVLPSWMDDINIDEFHVEGIISQEESAVLKQRFPNIEISQLETEH